MGKTRRRLFTKEDIAAHVSHLEGITMEQSNRIVRSVINAIILGLTHGYVVSLNGLMRMSGQYTKPRQGYHPLERTPMPLPATVRVSTTFSNRLRAILKAKVKFFEALNEKEVELPDAKELLKQIAQEILDYEHDESGNDTHPSE